MVRTGSAWRVGAAAVAVVAVAELAVWLLRPREAPIDPASVSEERYFTARELDRGRDYQSGQVVLLAVGTGIQAIVLVALATGRPGFVRRSLEELGDHPVRGAALAGTGLSVALAVVALPTAIAAHERAADYGIATQDLGPWLGDTGKGIALGALFAAGGAAALIGLVRRFGPRWWLPGSVAVAGIAVVFALIGPIVLSPLFNRFEKLPEDSAVRADVMRLADRAGVDVGDVYRVDASRRTTALNAYVNGIGPTKRVVLYDNLIESTPRPVLNSVVAHELAHVDHNDLWRGLAFIALVAPFGVVLTREVAEVLARRTGADPATPSALPAYAVGLALASFVIGIAGNQLSRRVEAGADTFALRLTGDPAALIDVQQRLVRTNVGDPDPPDAVTFLLGTHPPAIERIGAAVAYRRDEGR